MIYGGDGLGRLPADEHGRGKAVFIPFVLEGERVEGRVVEEKPGFVRARAETILNPSPNRIEPHCPYFLRCGGCHYQHTPYEHQLEIKAGVLKENLGRIAKVQLETELQVHASPPWNYRNRTRMQVRAEGDFVLGYYRHNSHAVLPVEECPISSPVINRAVAAVWKLGREGKISRAVREIEFFTNSEDNELLVEVYIQRDGLPEEDFKALADSLRNEMTEIIGIAGFSCLSSARGSNAGSEPEFTTGVRGITYKTRNASYRVSAGAFFQTNRHMVDELASIVTSGTGGATALDLYAGVGLFATVLKRNFERVIAVESSPNSFSDLQYNSTANVKAVRATSEEYLERAGPKKRAEVVVVDPPRGGLGRKVARKLGELGAPELRYVSCDPATLARDVVVLNDAGYTIKEAHLVDLFPQTFHIESVLRMAK